MVRGVDGRRGYSSPGKYYRRGISLAEAVQRFGDDAEAEAWFVRRRWPDGIRCVGCEGSEVSRRKRQRRTPSYHCNACGRDFTVKTGTVMHDSKLPLGTWALALYLFSTNLKGVSSMKLHRDLGVTVKTAWHLAHRIRETWGEAETLLGPVEVDETFIGGRDRNRHEPRRLGMSREARSIVLGVRDRRTGRVRARIIQRPDRQTLHAFIRRTTTEGSRVYTDGLRSYERLHGYQHEVVNHSVGEYVRDQAHTNGIESFWSMLKRGHDGVYHHMSPKHLGRYVGEFAGRHNDRPLDTEEQMSRMALGAVGRHLRYEDLVS